VFEQDGALHSNNPALLQDATTWRLLQGTDMAISASGRIMIVPDSGSPNNVCASSGICHRRVSYPGFTYVSANVSFPCNTVKTESGDTAYAYVGSWATPTAIAVDAGIQMTSPNQDDSVQAYMLAKGAVLTTSPDPNHFSCSPQQTFTETFQPLPYKPNGNAGSQELMLVDTGILIGGGNTVTIMAAFTGLSSPVIPLTCSTCLSLTRFSGQVVKPLVSSVRPSVLSSNS
jgi:hypothetical protein